MPTLDQIRERLLEGASSDDLDQGNSKLPKRWFFSRSRGEKAGDGLSSEVSNEKSREELKRAGFAVVAEAGAQVSETTQTLRELLSPLTQAEEQVDFLDVDVSSVLAAVNAFRQELEPVEQHFGAVKGFQKLLAHLTLDYQSLNDLHDQLSHMSGAFHEHLAQTAHMLEPAMKLHARATAVANELEQLNDLKQRLDDLARAFEVGPIVASGSTIPLMVPVFDSRRGHQSAAARLHVTTIAAVHK